ncbi:MAG: hypothetical protein HYX92_03460 [Chloroflexi bacterium]|nr:hypothetical protein [Chloroflexota bacterium]
MYKVLSPIGKTIVEVVPRAPRLLDLNGKTIGEIWNGGFRGSASFPIIRELLRKRYPDIKFVPYTEFPWQDIRGSNRALQERAEAAAALAREKGCDAVISGNGF